jgi:colanic acid biosynthesis glycosyl transferase WcaI
VKLLLIAINYWPELTGIGKYTGEMGEWLARHDVEVRVVTAPPYYPSWRVAPNYSAWRYHREQVAGVTVWRCPLWVPTRANGLKRILHLASFACSALPVTLWQAWRWRPDIVFVVEPPLFCAPAALLAARIAGAQAWMHIQDFEVDAAFELGILRSGWLQRRVLAAERWLLGRFDRVSTISDRMMDRLTAKGVTAARRMLFPNWVELDRIVPSAGVSLLRREWGLGESDVVVLYSGNMGEKQGIEILVEAARLLQGGASIHFLLCGDGVARARLERFADGLSNISFKPLQPTDRLNDLLNLADIHVLPQRSDAADLVLPSKLTNMLASGRPVVATASPGTQVADLVQDCGIVVAPGDAAALAAALAALATDTARRRSLGEAARRLAERLWDKNHLLSQAFALAADRE